mgnify:CR=1 FL=1
MKIGKVVKSDNHFVYKCRIYGKQETESEITEKDFALSQFVKLKLNSDITIIGIIVDSELINPDYGSLGARITSSFQNNITIPDFIDETGVMIDVITVGYLEKTMSYQVLPSFIIPLNAEVELMTNKEIINFHLSSNGKLQLKYYSHILNHAGKNTECLLVKVLENLMLIMDDKHHKHMSIIKQHIMSQLGLLTKV